MGDGVGGPGAPGKRGRAGPGQLLHKGKILESQGLPKPEKMSSHSLAQEIRSYFP